MLNPPREVFAMSDSLNLQDDNPTFLFGPLLEESTDEDTPPFYVILNIHNAILQNAMYDSGASHNMMPRIVMEELGLEVSRPYKDLFLLIPAKLYV